MCFVGLPFESANRSEQNPYCELSWIFCADWIWHLTRVVAALLAPGPRRHPAAQQEHKNLSRPPYYQTFVVTSSKHEQHSADMQIDFITSKSTYWLEYLDIFRKDIFIFHKKLSIKTMFSHVKDAVHPFARFIWHLKHTFTVLHSRLHLVWEPCAFLGSRDDGLVATHSRTMIPVAN